MDWPALFTVPLDEDMIKVLVPVVIFPSVKVKVPANVIFVERVTEPADLFTIKLLNDPVELIAWFPVWYKVQVVPVLVKLPLVIVQFPASVSV